MRTTNYTLEEKVDYKDLKIRIPGSAGCKLRKLKHLMYCLAMGAYTKLYFKDGSSELTSQNLKYHEEMLNEHGFHRISRATLVNMRYISFISREKNASARLLSGALLRVSQDRQAELMDELRTWLV